MKSGLLKQGETASLDLLNIRNIPIPHKTYELTFCLLLNLLNLYTNRNVKNYKTICGFIESYMLAEKLWQVPVPGCCSQEITTANNFCIYSTIIVRECLGLD